MAAIETFAVDPGEAWVPIPNGLYGAPKGAARNMLARRKIEVAGQEIIDPDTFDLFGLVTIRATIDISSGQDFWIQGRLNADQINNAGHIILGSPYGEQKWLGAPVLNTGVFDQVSGYVFGPVVNQGVYNVIGVYEAGPFDIVGNGFQSFTNSGAGKLIVTGSLRVPNVVWNSSTAVDGIVIDGLMSVHPTATFVNAGGASVRIRDGGVLLATKISNAGLITIDAGGTIGAASADGFGGFISINNAGVIDGDLHLSAGADSYGGGSGGRVIGAVYGGGGDDVLMWGESAVAFYGEAGNDKLAGTSYADVLSGGDGVDELDGSYGNDALDGGSGADVMRGGWGSDVYIVDDANDQIVGEDPIASGGVDSVRASVSWVLGDNVENLTLTGVLALSGYGNALNNIITGNDGANDLRGGAGEDVLDGGAGNDAMDGGANNDTYVVDAVGDVIVDISGTDTVRSHISWVLGAGLENLALLGASSIDGTGNDLANVITGNDASNILDGKEGADVLRGGGGDDTYIVDELAEQITDTGGVDTVRSSVAWSLGEGLENLLLVGVADLSGAGNSLNNYIVGNGGANELGGAEGDDVLDGGAGDDAMNGGAGNDTYVVDSVSDAITDLLGVDLVRSSVSWSLGAGLENLVLTGFDNINGTGNAAANFITGNSGANLLDGGAGDDAMDGGAGDDTYVVDAAGDAIADASGVDTVQSHLNWTLAAGLENLVLAGASLEGTGNDLANIITGNDAANVLDGRAGADSLSGGAGDDTYVVDDAGDAIAEFVDAGSDTVRSAITFTLGANLENLTLTGAAAIDASGNALANILTGNAAANVLDGATGADSLSGGLGDDTYIVDQSGDVIIEAQAGGVDTVRAAVTWTLGANLENLTLLGSSALNGTGNALANVIIGNSGANNLDGGSGADALSGGLGDDTYRVDSLGDSATEDVNAGIDTVVATRSWAVSSNIERVILSGSGNFNVAGNGLANNLKGNSGDNWLNGSFGKDTLTGGGGRDSFIFNRTLGANNIDTITDYDVVRDVIRIDNAVFAGIGAAGALAAGKFNTGAAATQADDRIIYDQSTGKLFFDIDGVGGAAQVQFATLSTRPSGMTASEFIVI